MKKTQLRILHILLMSALLLLALPACNGGNGEAQRLMQLDEEDRAYALYENMANSLLMATAFSVNSSTTFSGRLDGQELNLTRNVKRISKSQYGAARMDYFEESHLTKQGEQYWETRLISGYADGYLYRSNRIGGYTVNAKTAVPVSELDYVRLSEELMLHPQQWDCQTVTCVKNKDGSFTATFSGLSVEGLDELAYDYGLDLSMMGEYIYLTDATVVMNSTPELRFQSASFSLTYSEYGADGYLADRTFIVKTEQTFAYEIPESFKGVDLSAYDDIGDLTVLDDYVACMDNRVNAERGTYVYSLRETVTEDGEASVWLYDVKLDIDTYRDGLLYSSDGSYGYEGQLIRSRVAYADGTIEFRDTYPDGETVVETYEYTEADVRSLIAAELSLSDFSPVYVIRIEERDAEAGKYRFHLSGALQSDYCNYFWEMNGSMSYMDAYLDVTIQQDELMELELYLVAEGYTDTAESHRYEMRVSCSFGEKKTSSAPV